MTPSIDYTIERTVTLPVSWRESSSRMANIGPAAQYEQSLKGVRYKNGPAVLDREKLKERIDSSCPVVYPQVNVLRNGLRYVTIHNQKGEETFAALEYGGIEQTLDNRWLPTHRKPQALVNTDLGDGFFLRAINSGPARGHNSTTSHVYKNYKTQITDVAVDYSITPPVTVRNPKTPGEMYPGEFEFRYTQKSGDRSFTIHIKDGEHPSTTLKMACAGNDPVVFTFDGQGMFNGIEDSVGYALEESKWAAQFSNAKIPLLNIEPKMLDTQATLDALARAAVAGTTVSLEKALEFKKKGKKVLEEVTSSNGSMDTRALMAGCEGNYQPVADAIVPQ
ncbi:hypothetical protein HZB01_00955 [Candidatus Woesearchaeota archaeon]|nr:hypothetical protein [Candidatus Woesearchaeota archaeon]